MSSQYLVEEGKRRRRDGLLSRDQLRRRRPSDRVRVHQQKVKEKTDILDAPALRLGRALVVISRSMTYGLVECIECERCVQMDA